MKIGIVTDSTCDLPGRVVKRENISVVPMVIVMGGREYHDGVDISHSEFYQRLPGTKPAATTAAPGIQAYKDAYDKLARQGASEILSIHISEKLSAVVNVARQAATEMHNVKVTVLDSQQLSLGMGLQVLTAAQAARDGRSMAQILSLLHNQMIRTHTFAALDTLEYLKRSGRMNFAMSFLGTLLQIKPFLKMYEGNPTAERVRTREGAMHRLLELLQEYGPFEKTAILHSMAAGRAKDLLERAKSLLPEGEIIIEEITPVLGAHLGPGVLGFVTISQNK
jgi:DegV family protein with EDD domain